MLGLMLIKSMVIQIMETVNFMLHFKTSYLQTLIVNAVAGNTNNNQNYHRYDIIWNSSITAVFTVNNHKQGVALTKCNTTGPPCSVTVELELDWRRHNVIVWPARVKPPADPPCSVTDDDRCGQMPKSKTILAPYTMCRRARNGLECKKRPKLTASTSINLAEGCRHRHLSWDHYKQERQQNLLTL